MPSVSRRLTRAFQQRQRGTKYLIDQPNLGPTRLHSSRICVCRHYGILCKRTKIVVISSLFPVVSQRKSGFHGISHTPSLATRSHFQPYTAGNENKQAAISGLGCSPPFSVGNTLASFLHQVSQVTLKSNLIRRETVRFSRNSVSPRISLHFTKPHNQLDHSVP